MNQADEGREEYGDQSVDPEDQLQAQDTLEDRGVADVLDEGYSPPDREPHHLRSGTTLAEQREGASLDERLAAEEPDPDPYAASDEQVADSRAGRLVAPDEGAGSDHERDAIATDVGIDGAGASAEEAAVHVIDAEADPGAGPETEPE